MNQRSDDTLTLADLRPNSHLINVVRLHTDSITKLSFFSTSGADNGIS